MSPRTETPRPARAARRSRASGVSLVIGELLLTAGALIALFLGWQLWFNDLVVGAQQGSAAVELQERWMNGVAEPGDTAEPPGDAAEPPAEGTGFAILHVPRFGADFSRVIGEGVGTAEVLNRADLGVGHYPGTQMPGEVGNFAIAAHRTTWGAPFQKLAELQLGDRIYVQTEDGWFTYAYRSIEYVRPEAIGVVGPVPQHPGVQATDRMITLTTCNPLLSSAERLIAYGVLESWQPASAGMPEELAAMREGTA